jgi:hypothetical protein
MNNLLWNMIVVPFVRVAPFVVHLPSHSAYPVEIWENDKPFEGHP